MKTSLPIVTDWQILYAEQGLGLTPGCSALPMQERWIPAQVPGDVHLDCQRAGIIGDPFFGLNHDSIRWMEEWDWWYRAEVIPPERKSGQRLFLNFEGLDCFATVYLNGKEVARSHNMFVPLRVDVTETVQEGTNRLEVCLGAPVHPPHRPSRQEGVIGYGNSLRLQIRKAQCSYGWNIAPRLVTTGIWKPVEWILSDEYELTDACVETVGLREDGSAEVELIAEVLCHNGLPGIVEIQFDMAGISQSFPVNCDQTGGRGSARLIVPDAMLWWPHNHGDPHLYPWQAILSKEGRILDQKSGTVGIRTVRAVQEPDSEEGIAFLLEINSKRIFLKGMNWTPADAVFSRIDEARYVQLVDAAKGANCNALRIWGGGIYEGDSFYRYCDSQGILVLHDFMFACGCYPQDDAFLADARREATYHVRRLRRYACLVLWFGDNENDALSHMTFEQPEYRTNPLNKVVLAEVVRTYAPRTPYLPSSPFSPVAWHQNTDREGDCHIWGHGLSYDDPFYSDQRPRMVTEIGHLSFPSREVIESWVPKDKLWPVWHEIYLTHGADCSRLDRHARYRYNWENIRLRGLPEPENLDELIARTQQIQGEASRYWIEFYGNQKTCWGIFLWNLADCWPQMSDAYIAFPFHPKASLEYVREAYAKMNR